MTYTILRQNEQYGPYTLEQIRIMAQAGQLMPMDVLQPQGSSGSTTVQALLQTAQSDGTGGLIPYKNGPALTGYYLGVLSLVPALGLLTGIVAFILGVMGLRKVKAQPAVRGTAHAWVAIVLGGGSFLLHVALIILTIVAYTKTAK